ncbi:hypothetical protein [Hydrogenophaga sp.]|uniref:hypothetical protein n=1 Tax=Hydrogenophaga sp. TaxID=1904254 RepID=UPI0025BAD34F|nr:hypothetical protein [Hydrogenophaga sp.]MDP2986464.1 hypothetical protein [Hydrogenophaga sp.]
MQEFEQTTPQVRECLAPLHQIPRAHELEHHVAHDLATGRSDQLDDARFGPEDGDLSQSRNLALHRVGMVGGLGKARGDGAVDQRLACPARCLGQALVRHAHVQVKLQVLAGVLAQRADDLFQCEGDPLLDIGWVCGELLLDEGLQQGFASHDQLGIGADITRRSIAGK